MLLVVSGCFVELIFFICYISFGYTQLTRDGKAYINHDPYIRIEGNKVTLPINRFTEDEIKYAKKIILSIITYQFNYTYRQIILIR